MKRIIVTGSIANDYLMTFPGDFSDHILPDKIDILSVSFLVDSLRRQPGGCAANIAFTLALLGERPTVMATVGPDYEADRLRLENHGVDTSLLTTVDEHTASFFVSTDQGSRQIASFFVGAMGAADQLSFHDFDTSAVEAVIISPNAPSAMAKYVRECQALGLRYIYDPSQQIVRLSAEDLAAGIRGSWILIANEYEFELIREKTGLDAEAVLGLTETLIITRGEHGSIIRRHDGVHVIPPVPPVVEADPTGVGDAYRSGVIFGLLHGLDWPTTARVGSLCGTYCVEHTGPQAHHFTVADFLARYEASFGAVPEGLRAALVLELVK